MLIIAEVAGAHFGTGARDAMIVLLATSMGAQVAAIRHVKAPDMATVVLTLTITAALVDRGAGWTEPAMLPRGIAVLAFAAGALSGGLLILNASLTAALALGLAIIFGVLTAAHTVSDTVAAWAAPR